MSSSSSRMPLIDMVKGLACITIVWHHLAFYGPMSDVAQSLAPGLLAWLYDYGRMAVQVFLVLGGYLAVASLAPQGTARFDHAGHAVARRFVRLIVPYAVVLLLTILVSAAVRPWLDHPSVPGEPTLAQLFAHALLLQDIVGEEALSAGVWYVAIDFQLYACSVLLWAAARALPGRWSHAHRAALAQGAVVACMLASLWMFNRVSELDMWAPYFAGAYALGMLAYWAVHARNPWGWTALLVGAGLAALAIDFRGRIAVAGGTALWLVVVLRSPAARNWRAVPALVQVGQMSYSIFLVHFAVCLLVNATFSQLWPASPALNALGMALAFAMSLAAGRQLYLRVERHVPSLSTALRWQVGLVGAGMLVSMASYWG